MGVKVRKIRGSWYLVINYHGKRKTKKIGSSLSVARDVARQVEAKLALGDMAIFGENEGAAPVFSEYATRWMDQHIAIRKKPATLRAYGVMMDNHIKPQFGNRRVDAIMPAHVEDFIFSLATKRDENGSTVYAQKTISLAIAVLRSFFSYCQRTGKISSNPASRLGEVKKSDKESRPVESMTRKEAELFLEAVQRNCECMFPLFLCALRTGMRRGELIGMRWGDISFGADDSSDRYIMVQRTYSYQGFGTPKSGKSRRVDMSRQLRSVLMVLRDERLMAAMQLGKDSISGDLVFREESGTPINPQTLAARYMEPALATAGLRRFTPHALRHTFAVLALQSGAPLKYVSEQLGHSSIIVTANVYGHFQPGANVHLMDRLDSQVQTDANQAQTQKNRDTMNPEQVPEMPMVNAGAETSQVLTIYYSDPTENSDFAGVPTAERGELRQSPQTPRKRGGTE